MLPILHIGPFGLQTPGLVLLIGVFFAISRVEKHAAAFKVDGNILANLVLIGLGSGLVGGRFSYALQYAPAFIKNPLALISFTPTMFNLEGGLLICILAAFIYGQRKHLPLLPVLDALSLGLALFLAALHLANLASGDAYGVPASLPWSITLWGAERHPVQIYEFFTAGLIAFYLRPGVNLTVRPGTFFWSWIALTALARLFFDTFRADSQVIIGAVHLPQLFAWACLALALWQLNPQRKEPAWTKPS